MLAGVPGTIGDGGEARGAVDPTAVSDDAADPVAELMRQVAFEPQDVQDTLAEFFDWIAAKFDSDHWKLSERQARMLGMPLTQVLNTVWAELCRALPGPIARWIESTPGAMKLLIAAGIVLTPKIKQQLSISRERRALKKKRDPNRPAPPVSPRPAAGGFGVPRPEPVKPIVWGEPHAQEAEAQA